MSLDPQIIGITAGVFTAVSLLPQVIKTIKKKSAKDISVFVFILLLLGNGMWVFYGVLKQDWPIIATNGFSVCVDLTMLVLKMRFGKK